jgi:DNA repair protein RecN (Recombination protein N)
MPLRELRINNFAVIAQANVSLEDGFVVLTGETGAGKSVCLQALRAVMAEKADATLLRHGSLAATVSAVFDEVPAAVTESVAALGIDPGDMITISREISPTRSSFRINGALVSAAVVKQVTGDLVEVTAQGVSSRIYRSDWQRALLDRAAGPSAEAVLDQMRDAFRERNRARESLAAAEARALASADEVIRATQIVEDLEKLKLESGERDRLLVERGQLRHASSIATAARTLHHAISGDEASTGAIDVLTRAAADAEAVREFSPDVDAVCTEVSEAMARLREISHDARNAAENVVVDSQRLAWVEERLDAIARVERRFGSVEEAVTALAAAQELLASSAAPEAVLAQARANAEETERKVGDAAATLRGMRKKTAKALQKEVTGNLQLLDLPHARFVIEIAETNDPEGVEVDGRRVCCTSDGADDIDFRLSTNKDSLPMPLGNGPSGGELSRLVLALGAVVADNCPTLVFDEVDTGVGGETAARVGEMLAAMGSRRQVIAVTHRAEIAARAQAHLQVTKSEKAGKATSTVATVDGALRIEEMARLLSGRQTKAAVSRATELLDEGGQLRTG